MKEKEMIERLDAGEDPLELSIEKWQDIVDGTGKCDGIYNCALCEKYVKDFSPYCKGCPVKEKTHKQFCQGTPYAKYSNELDKYKHDTTTLQTFAKEELAFLKSLRLLWKKMKEEKQTT